MRGKPAVVAVPFAAAFVILAFIVFLPSVQALPTTTCNSCADCSAKLNGAYSEVILDADIINYAGGTCIVFGADGVTFNGNNKIIDGTKVTGSYGVNLNGKSNIVLKNSKVQDFDYGIRNAASSSNVKIEKNYIYSHKSDGILLGYANNYYIFDNTIEMNGKNGIYIDTSNGNMIKFNRVRTNSISSTNTYGIRLYRSDNNVVSYNQIYDHDEYGLSVVEATSDNNLIYHNSLVNNNVGINQVRDLGTNTQWQNGYPNGGNLWRATGSSPPCEDILGSGIPGVGDGICDQPVTIAPSNAMDSYPLVDLEFITHSVTLQPGFNFVSSPIRAKETTLPELLSSIDGSYDLVYYYDSATGMWMSYNANGPPEMNTLAGIPENEGFWIHVTSPSPVQWSVEGSTPVNERYNLLSGWNMISYPNTASKPVADALQNVGSYNSVWGYDSVTGQWSFYQPGNPASTLTTMEPGHGYWIDANLDSWDFLKGEGEYYSLARF